MAIEGITEDLEEEEVVAVMAMAMVDLEVVARLVSNLGYFFPYISESHR